MTLKGIIGGVACCLITMPSMCQVFFSQPSFEGENTPEAVFRSISESGNYLHIAAWNLRATEQLLGGAVDCPIFPEPWDVVQLPDKAGKAIQILLIRPENEEPCAEFLLTQHGEYKRIAQVGTLNEEARIQLLQLRAARHEFSPILGPGRQRYIWSPGHSPDTALVYAWKEHETGNSMEALRIGPAMIAYVGGGADVYVVRKVFILLEEALSWSAASVPGKGPLGIRSALVVGEESFFTPLDVVTARSNPGLCPRLFKSDHGSFILNRDGTWRVVQPKENRKIREVPTGYVQVPLPTSKQVDNYRKESPLVVRPGAASDPQPNSSPAPERAPPPPPINYSLDWAPVRVPTALY